LGWHGLAGVWQCKRYPVSEKETKRHYGDVRADGHIFYAYSRRHGHVYESWLGPEAFARLQEKAYARNREYHNINRSAIVIKKRSWRKNNSDRVRRFDEIRRRRQGMKPQRRFPVTLGRKFGDVREDGYRFRGYEKDRRGTAREAWMSPEAYDRRIAWMIQNSKSESRRAYNKTYAATYSSRPDVRARRSARARLPENRSKLNAHNRRKTATDPSYAIRRRVKSRLSNALKAYRLGKRWNTMSLIGCDIEHLVKHLESQFLPGMSWDNRSAWHIDHKIPFCKIDTTNATQLAMVCHYTNLRPLWSRDNLSRNYDDVALPV
jgi:hypothetical protein